MRILKLIFLFLALIWPFGQLFELPFFGVGTHLYVLDIVILFLCLYLFIHPKHWKFIKDDPLFKPVSIFALIAFISLLVALPTLSFLDFFIAALYLLRWLAYTSVYFAFKLLKPNLKHIKIILFSLALFTLFGLLQYLFLPDTRVLYYLGFDDHFYRLIGTLLDPNYSGLIFVIFILLLLSHSRYQLLAIFPGIALALTYSRASYLTLILVFLYLLFRSPKRIYLVILLLLPFILYFSPKPYGEGVNLLRTFSITSRINDAGYGLTLFQQKPIFGHGFNTLRSIKVSDSSLPNRAGGGLSNSFIFILATTGILGLIAYLNLLRHVLKLTWSNPYYHGSILAIIFHSFFNNSLFYIWVMTLFWLIISYKTLETSSR